MARKSSKSKRRASTSKVANKSSVLSKVGTFVKKALPIAANLVPGPVGMVLKAISGNDPEWWSAPAGTELTTNEPYSDGIDMSVTIRNALSSQTEQTVTPRFSLLDLASTANSAIPSSTAPAAHVMEIPDEFVATYLLPAIRKVVNAVYLRQNSEYKAAFEVAATIYALKKTLEKWRYLTKNPRPIYADLTSGRFPMLTTANKANLDAAIQQLEEKLRASIRLPATLCRYLDWRFAKIFKSNASAKAGLITYNVVPMEIDYENLDATINSLFDQLTATAQANVDIFNAYMGHTQDVEIGEEMQYQYDAKEFVLRGNLDLFTSATGQANVNDMDSTPSLFIMDSELDNRTVFMASCVSTAWSDGTQRQSLFPVAACWAYHHYNVGQPGAYLTDNTTARKGGWERIVVSSGFVSFDVGTNLTFSGGGRSLKEVMAMLLACKQLDFYNVGIFVKVTTPGGATSYYDLTSISIDCGLVTESQVRMEQKFAFANLVSDRANYMGRRGELNALVNDVDELVQQVAADGIKA